MEMITPNRTAGFNVSGNKGFQITFENGWTVSVQFGVCNYCEHNAYSYSFGDEKKQETWKSEDAEIAIFHSDPGKPWYSFGNDTVKGYCSTGEVAMWIGKVASWDKDGEKENECKAS